MIGKIWLELLVAYARLSKWLYYEQARGYREYCKRERAVREAEREARQDKEHATHTDGRRPSCILCYREMA